MITRRSFVAALSALVASPVAAAKLRATPESTAPRCLCEHDIDNTAVCHAIEILLDGVPQAAARAYNADAGWVRRIDMNSKSYPAPIETVYGVVTVNWRDDEESRAIRREYEVGMWPTAADLLRRAEL